MFSQACNSFCLLLSQHGQRVTGTSTALSHPAGFKRQARKKKRARTDLQHSHELRSKAPPETGPLDVHVIPPGGHIRGGPHLRHQHARLKDQRFRSAPGRYFRRPIVVQAEANRGCLLRRFPAFLVMFVWASHISGASATRGSVFREGYKYL